MDGDNKPNDSARELLVEDLENNYGTFLSFVDTLGPISS